MEPAQAAMLHSAVQWYLRSPSERGAESMRRWRPLARERVLTADSQAIRKCQHHRQHRGAHDGLPELPLGRDPAQRPG